LAQNKRTFHTHERGDGDLDAYSLVRDGGTGEVYVLHEWTLPGDGGPVQGAARLDLDGFLLDSGVPQQRLRELIGTLIGD
jgi:hypothetical protein